MILFRTIRYKNLLSTGNYFTEIKLDNNTNTLVVGENGSGKSTMLDALCFSLFGKAFRNVNKPQLLNSINQKDCVVEVEFDANNKSYKIIRGIKPGIFEIYQNGILLNQDAAIRDYQEHLEKFILKMNYKSFTQIVILGSASFVPFMQLSASDRRAIIEDLLDIQIFSTMNGIVKNRISTNKDETSAKKYDIDLTRQKYELEKKHIEELKQNNDEKVKHYETEIQTNNGTIQTLHDETVNLSAEVVSYSATVALQTETEGKVKKLGKLESQIENNLSKFNKDISFFSHNDDCPTCRQAIAMEFKEEQLSALQTKTTQCEDGLKELETKLLDEQSKLNHIAGVQKTIQTLQIKIATNSASITQIQKYIVKIQKEIDQLQVTKGSTDIQETQLKELSGHLSKLQLDLKELIDIKTYYETASGLLKDTGIKTKIVRQYLPIINKLINKYLSSLDFFVNFNLDDSFKETIKSRHRDDFSYHNFSEGEKSKINLSLLFAWRDIARIKNSASTNLLILDEIVDGALDHNGIDNFLKLIRGLSDDTCVFVISPKGDVYSDTFQQIIRFEKRGNFSSIKK